jgi:hypothetical protein
MHACGNRSLDRTISDRLLIDQFIAITAASPPRPQRNLKTRGASPPSAGQGQGGPAIHIYIYICMYMYI